MALIDDGDLIRGLGFVALYAAYLEEAVDDCLSVVAAHDPKFDVRLNRRATSQKIEYLHKQLEAVGPLSKELSCLPEVLVAASQLLEERNNVIHGRVYAIPGTGDTIFSGRPGIPKKAAKSEELYNLANRIIGVRNPILHASRFALSRQMSAK
ncbi:hypothetical protein [Hydrogenophaga atypica]|uniref:hypothetical protein n=1 Tax=Hydrogenophaga atypica TaxID=249409 RepID=UPI0036D338F6